MKKKLLILILSSFSMMANIAYAKEKVPVTVDCAPGLDSLGADLYEAWNASFIEQIFIC